MTQAFEPDEETGLMTPPVGSGPNLYTFDSKTKLIFLDLLRKMFPHVKKVCDIVGISRQTYLNHYSRDPRFKDLVDEIKEERLDHLESVMLDMGEKPSGFMDRIAYLRAHRPHLYNPAQKIIVERQDHLTLDAAKVRVERLKNVIDADIVETYDKRNLPPPA